MATFMPPFCDVIFSLYKPKQRDDAAHQILNGEPKQSDLDSVGVLGEAVKGVSGDVGVGVEEQWDEGDHTVELQVPHAAPHQIAVDLYNTRHLLDSLESVDACADLEAPILSIHISRHFLFIQKIHLALL